MGIDQLIFVGFNGYAMALDRDTGEIVWTQEKMRSSGGYVTLLLDGDRLIVSSDGYMYCLEPLTGEVLWHNPTKGYGTGATSLLSVRGQGTPPLVMQAQCARRRSSDSSPSTSTSST